MGHTAVQSDWLSFDRMAVGLETARAAFSEIAAGIDHRVPRRLDDVLGLELETVQMLRHRHAAEAVLYAALSCLGGLMAARAGHGVSLRLNGRRRG